MPHVDRPPKAGNTRQFQTEVAAGFIDILANEVDGDIDTIYALCNGNLADDNIAANAHIAYSKLSLAGSIKGSDMASGANIPGSALAPGTVPGNALVPGSVGPTQITANSIGPGQLIDVGFIDNKANFVAGVTTWDTKESHDYGGLSIPATEMIISQVSLASRGGFYLMLGRLAGNVSANPGENMTLTVRLLAGGNPNAGDGTEVDRATMVIQTAYTGTGAYSLTAPFAVTVFAIGGLSGNPTWIKLSAQRTAPQAAGGGFTCTSRKTVAWELA